MSSEGTPGTPVPERAVAVVATVGALVLLAGVALSARGTATSDERTVLVSADAGTVLVTEAGERPARAGDEVPDGAGVRTAEGGSAALETAGRTVRLAPGSLVVVVDGARQRLERGAALVDAAEGPGVRLTAAGSTVDVREDAVVRVDRERLLRVAAYRAPVDEAAADVRAPGRRRTVVVRALHQLQVAGGLAGTAVPLALRAGDAWEREELPQLVADDLLLQGYARMLAEAPAVVAATLPAAERPEGTEADVVAEQTLAYALAHDDGAFDPETYVEVQDGRSLGGSWGVVAALADATAAGAERFLDRGSVVDAVPAALLAADDAVALASDVLAGLPGLAGDEVEGDLAEEGQGEAGPTGSARPTRPSQPGTPPPGSEPSRGPLQEVVDTVTDALPVPLPVPVPTPPPSARPPLVDVQVEAPAVDRAVEETVGGAVDGAVDGVGGAVDSVVDGVVGGVLGR